MEDQYKNLSVIASSLADDARRFTLRHYKTGLRVEYKDDGSTVTEADKLTEFAMRSIIKDLHPDHGIFDKEAKSCGYRIQFRLDSRPD